MHALAICGELSDGTPSTRPNAVSVYLREALLPTQLLALAIAVIIYSITSIYHSMSFLARLYAKGMSIWLGIEKLMHAAVAHTRAPIPAPQAAACKFMALTWKPSAPVSSS